MSRIFVACGKNHKERQNDRQKKEKEQKKYISLQLSHNLLWFPLIRQVTQGTAVCVCMCVCACLWSHWLVVFLRKRQEKERGVSEIVETLICPLTNHKGQGLYFWHEAPWEQIESKKGEGWRIRGFTERHRTTESGRERGKGKLGANGLWDTDIISYLKWQTWLDSPLYN